MRLSQATTEEQERTTASTTAASTATPPQNLGGVGAAENAERVGATRLTPEEAAEAIAALESRRMARANDAHGTISIDDVISQLEIDATPEELMEAVTAIRRRRGARESSRETTQAATTRIVPVVRDRGRRRVLATGMAAATLVAVGTMLLTKPRVDTGAVAAPAAEVVTPAASFAATGAETNVGKLTVIDRTSGHPVSRLMSEIPDNRPITVQAETLETTLEIPPTQGYEAGGTKGWWTAKKEKGRVFLRGFLPLPVSPGVAAQGHLVVTDHSHRPNGMAIGPEPTPVWVPLDRVRSIDSFYSTDATAKEGDNTGGTFAPDSSGDVSPDWSRVFVDDLKPGDLQPDRR